MNYELKNKRIVNIGNDKEEKKISYMAKMLLEITNNSNKIINKIHPEGSVNRRCPDISLLRSLDFRPAVSLIEGLIKTVKWYNNIFENIKYPSYL